MKAETLFDEAAEKAVVCILLEESASLGAKRGVELLGACGLMPEDFAHAGYRVLYSAVAALLLDGAVPVVGVLAKRIASHHQRESWEALAPLLENDELLTAAQLPTFAKVVGDLAIRRNVRAAAQRIERAAWDFTIPVPKLLSMFAEEMRRIRQRAAHWQDGLKVLERNEAAIRGLQDAEAEPCVRSGFWELDKVTGGFPPTLCVIAAMPGVGKSAFWGAVLRNAAKRGVTSASFSMEDRMDWLGYRLLAHESGVNQFILRNKRLSEEQWDRVAGGFASVRGYVGRIFLDDRPALRPEEVLYAARTAIADHGARLIGLDNMTAMRFTRGHRMDLEIQDFLCDARALADEFKVPFVVISHVKRRDGLEPGDMPRLTDCSETSAFEKLSRMAIALSRANDSDELSVRVLKNTNGRAGVDFTLPFNPSAALVGEAPYAAQ